MFTTFQDVLPPDRVDADERHVAYFRGRLMPLRDANINIMTHAFLFGTAVHEGLRGYARADGGGIAIFRLHDHITRLVRNAKVLKTDLSTQVDALCDATVAMIRANGFTTDCYIRTIAYKSGLQIGLLLSPMSDVAMFAIAQSGFQETVRPMSLAVSSWRRVEDNAIPARAKINGAYVNSALAMTEARDNGCDDAVFLSEDGRVSEGSGMNLLIVRDGTLITPGPSENILEGITRETVLTLAQRELGLAVEVRPIARSELYTADEVILCGTGVEIVPVGAVDHRPVGNGDHAIAHRLRTVYFDVVRGANATYAHWLTTVTGVQAGAV